MSAYDNGATRRLVWNDETLPPSTAAAEVALWATGANMSMVRDWCDLVGPDPDGWMTYADWIRGAIGIAVEQLAYGEDEVDAKTPREWVSELGYLVELWEELEKLDPGVRFLELGDTPDERLRLAASLEVEDRLRLTRVLAGESAAELAARAAAVRRLDRLEKARRREEAS